MPAQYQVLSIRRDLFGKRLMIHRVRLFNVGLHFLAEKVAFPCLSVDRFGKKFWGLMTLGHVKSVPNFY